MPDNVNITPGSGATIAADEISSVLYQRVKIAAGADGSATDVSDAAPLPVDDAGGSLTVDNADITTIAGAISGTEMQVDVVTSALPTGASTAANQTTIIGHVDGIEALLTTIDADTSSLAGAITGTEVQVDIVSSALPTGAATAALQTSSEALLTTIDADTSTLAGAVSGTEVQVDVVGSLPAGTNAIGKLAANSGVDIGDVDVTSIAAGENLIGLVGASDIVVTITPTVAAEAHSAGDLLFDSTEIANAVRVNAGTALVESITIVDKGDQKPSIHLLFANAATDFGAPGGVPDPDDTEALTVIGVVEVDTADYVDLGGASVVTVPNIGLLLKAGAATTSIYLAGIAVGTPTPASTSDYQIAIGLLRS